MKKILISLIIIMFMSTSNIFSQYTCPSGFSMVTHTLSGGNGCMYVVDICVKCVPTHPGELELHPYRIRAHYSNPKCRVTDEVIENIYSQVTSAHFIFNYLCTWMTPPPCKSEDPGDTTAIDTLIVTVKNYFCYYEYEDSTYYNKDTLVEAASPCFLDKYCEVKIRYCMRIDLIPPQFISQIIETNIFPDPIMGIPWKECPLYEYVDKGECFIRETECHP